MTPFFSYGEGVKLRQLMGFGVSGESVFELYFEVVEMCSCTRGKQRR